MSKPNEQPDDIVSMNFSLKRHEREAITRKAKAVGMPAYRYMIDLAVSGRLPKRK